jgi:2-haloacid dehalogenase
MPEGASMLNFESFEVFTFDCYGTLIDWESGISSAMGEILEAHGIAMNKEEVLELFAELESRIEAGEFCNYKTVLMNVAEGFGEKLGFTPDKKELDQFSMSVRNWPPFQDSTDALNSLKKKFGLAVISNVDNDLFEFSKDKLKTDFDWIITAEDIGSYKPALRNFHYAIEKIGLPKEKILHVAQSLYHDIAPAGIAGLKTVWINRRHKKEGFGATPRASANPDIEVPDLLSLVSLSGL